jgi:hypothetical protein
MRCYGWKTASAGSAAAPRDFPVAQPGVPARVRAGRDHCVALLRRCKDLMARHRRAASFFRQAVRERADFPGPWFVFERGGHAFGGFDFKILAPESVERAIGIVLKKAPRAAWPKIHRVDHRA